MRASGSLAAKTIFQHRVYREQFLPVCPESLHQSQFSKWTELEVQWSMPFSTAKDPVQNWTARALARLLHEAEAEIILAQRHEI